MKCFIWSCIRSSGLIWFGCRSTKQTKAENIQQMRSNSSTADRHQQLFYCARHSYLLLCFQNAGRVGHYRWLLNFGQVIWEGKCSDPMEEAWCIKLSLLISILTADLVWWMFQCQDHAEGIKQDHASAGWWETCTLFSTFSPSIVTKLQLGGDKVTADAVCISSAVTEFRLNMLISTHYWQTF